MGFVYALMVAMAVAVAVACASKVPQGYYCSTPQAPKNGQLRSNGDPPYLPGHVIYYSCDGYGYKLHGQSQSQCDYDSSSYLADWRYPAPVCKAVDCGDLDDPDYGNVDFNSTIVASEATYTCHHGYYLVGDVTRVCQYSGKWSGYSPVCKRIALGCGDLDDPNYGDVEFSSTTVGSEATYSCHQGYYLVGPKTRLCLYQGKWGGNTPLCKPVDCGGLDYPDYGDVDFGSTTVGSMAAYTCQPGYYLVGDAARLCLYNGKWGGYAPVCKLLPPDVVDCGELSNPSYGHVLYHCTTSDCIANYSCTYGYKLHGGNGRVCQINGHWSGSQPWCEPAKLY